MLTNVQEGQLIEALLSAYLTPNELREMVRVRLGKNLYEFTLGDTLKEIVFKLVERAESDGWTAQLITAARESRPGNPLLLAFSQQFGLASTNLPRNAVEKMLKGASGFLDVDKWRTRLGEIETQVCRIEIKTNLGWSYGTGFLVGSESVITNYHVVEAVIRGEKNEATAEGAYATHQDVVLRFDYKVLADGNEINPGTKYRLVDDAQSWLIDSSPNNAPGTTPRVDELDYALLRVEGVPGDSTVGDKSESDAPKRGWVTILTQTYKFVKDARVLIMQHPEAEPLKLALDPGGIVGVNANNTRVQYAVITEPGSSGSPCFNINWDLIALHHSGDPSPDPTYNEGIPIGAILQAIEQHGAKGTLGKMNL